MKNEKTFFLAILLLTISIAQAVPTYVSNGQMTWSRGASGSTYQDWTFDNGNTTAIPEDYFNPYVMMNDPSIQGPMMDLAGFNGSVPFQWKNGVWMGDPIYALITIPNNPVANPFKVIWFEMKYKAVDMLLPEVTVDQGFAVQEIYNNDIAATDGWRLMTKGWEIRPNPSIEMITFALAGTGGFLDSVSVDTLCAVVPAPGAIIMGTIGIVITGLLRRRM